MVGAWLYTLLTGRGAALVIGTTMMRERAVAPLPLPPRPSARRKRARGRLLRLRPVVGGTTGAGIMMLSLLMATGLAGAAVIATDAAVSIVIGIVKLSVFGLAGVPTAKTLALALLIGIVGFPGAFLAKRIVEGLPVRLHTAMLDAVVIGGGAMLIFGAFRN